jgi:hypothetical protein
MGYQDEPAVLEAFITGKDSLHAVFHYLCGRCRDRSNKVPDYRATYSRLQVCVIAEIQQIAVSEDARSLDWYEAIEIAPSFGSCSLETVDEDNGFVRSLRGELCHRFLAVEREVLFKSEWQSVRLRAHTCFCSTMESLHLNRSQARCMLYRHSLCYYLSCFLSSAALRSILHPSVANPFHILQQYLLTAAIIEFRCPAICVAGDALSGFQGAVIFQKIGDAGGPE